MSFADTGTRFEALSAQDQPEVDARGERTARGLIDRRAIALHTGCITASPNTGTVGTTALARVLHERGFTT